MKNKIFAATVVGLGIGFATFIGCSKSSDSKLAAVGTPANPPADTPNQATGIDGGFVQVERLARPAINEGLVISNDYLNAFNSIPPGADLSDAAAPVRAEAITVLDVVTGLIAGGPTSAQVAAQFLPDVMRIDTVVSNPGVGPSTIDANVGYISCVNATGAGPLLCGGRKLEDDVMDITLSYIASNIPTHPYTITNNINYTTSHSTLPTAFPYLAVPR